MFLSELCILDAARPKWFEEFVGTYIAPKPRTYVAVSREFVCACGRKFQRVLLVPEFGISGEAQGFSSCVVCNEGKQPESDYAHYDKHQFAGSHAPRTLTRRIMAMQDLQHNADLSWNNNPSLMADRGEDGIHDTEDRYHGREWTGFHIDPRFRERFKKHDRADREVFADATIEKLLDATFPYRHKKIKSCQNAHKWRNVLRLYFRDGCLAADIADGFDLSRGNVEKIIATARRKIAKLRPEVCPDRLYVERRIPEQSSGTASYAVPTETPCKSKH